MSPIKDEHLHVWTK